MVGGRGSHFGPLEARGVKSCFKDHFLLVMVPSKGQVDHDVRQLYVACRRCAAAVPFQTFDFIFRAPQ